MRKPPERQQAPRASRRASQRASRRSRAATALLAFVVLLVTLLPPGGAASPIAAAGPGGLAVRSPDGQISLTVSAGGGRLTYSVARRGQVLVRPSALGLKLTDGTTLGGDVTITSVSTRATDNTWRPVWGTDATVRDHYRELTVELRQADGRTFSLVARAYDDGVAFRYRVPEQPGLSTLRITDEATEFALADDPVAWWTPRDFDSDEHAWRTTPYREMDASNTPVTFRYPNGTHLSIHEADLVDYAAMTVVPDGGKLRAALVPTPNRDAAVVTDAGRATPWRALTITDGAGGLVESHLLENLNPPCAICDGDTSWIKPTTYVGIWWLMHHGQATWETGPRHGATTARAKEHIDFAAAHGIKGLLAEGWNAGWEGSWADQDFTTPTPDFDLEEVVAYGKRKGVEFIAHNETGGGVENYERQLDEAFALYRRLGIRHIKTGYVGAIDGHHHYDQRMVNHYRLVLEKAAKHGINVNCHECVHAAGEVRTYPNAMAREAMRGQEYDAWSDGNSPEHTMILPFTRGLSGPMDYTPGIMNILWNPQGGGRRVHTTVAKQLAYYVNYFSGVQMAADLPEHYEDAPGLRFIEDLPVTWDETRVLSAGVGDHLVTARRSGAEWRVGAMTGDRAQTLRYRLGFLGKGHWVAEAYTDAASTDYEKNPTALAADKAIVTAEDTFVAALERSGGQAVRFRPATSEDLAELPRYTPPRVKVDKLAAPAEAEAGDIVTIAATVSNPGSLPVRAPVTMTVADSRIEQTRTARIDGGDTSTVTFQARVTSRQAMTVRVGDQEAVIRVTRPDDAVPAPEDLAVTHYGTTHVTLGWQPVPDASYQVFRREADGIYRSEPLAEIPAGTTSFRDSGVSTGVPYSYVVRAVVDGRRSVPSNEVTETPRFFYGERIGELTDPAGDDDGPGTYAYPTAGEFNPGAYDLTGLEVYRDRNTLNLVTTVHGEIHNPWGGDGMSVHRVNVYLRTDASTGDADAPALPGTNLATAGAWQRAVVADGRYADAEHGRGVYDPDGAKVADARLTVLPDRKQIIASIPVAALGGADPAKVRYAVAMFGAAEPGEGIGQVRPVYDYDYWDAGDPWWIKAYRFGGGAGEWVDSPSHDSDTRDPNAIDIVVGPGQSQAEVMDWRAHSPVAIPLLPLVT